MISLVDKRMGRPQKAQIDPEISMMKPDSRGSVASYTPHYVETMAAKQRLHREVFPKVMGCV